MCLDNLASNKPIITNDVFGHRPTDRTSQRNSHLNCFFFFFFFFGIAKKGEGAGCWTLHKVEAWRLCCSIDILDYVNGIGNRCMFARSTPPLLVGTETRIFTMPIHFSVDRPHEIDAMAAG